MKFRQVGMTAPILLPDVRPGLFGAYVEWCGQTQTVEGGGGGGWDVKPVVRKIVEGEMEGREGRDGGDGKGDLRTGVRNEDPRVVLAPWRLSERCGVPECRDEAVASTVEAGRDGGG